MTPERFQQIEELYHAARESTAQERAELLAHADPELRSQVESLLLAQDSAEPFLDRPALEDAPHLLGDPASLVEVSVGANLGPYRIEAKIGEGGMGEVFRAVDTRLGRAVAIKTAHEQFSAHFEREARAISSLNHPHICTLYDVGPNYLVMELVEGETIAERLKSGPLPPETALLYASQIAAALTEAHGKGIIHRDLKPGNIMIAKSGVKVLDFGLARLGQDESVATTRMVLGTPAYMAPEQMDGKPGDFRSDIYSFGCVLYEMLTGARAGSSPGKRIPSRDLERIVSRCMERDPSRRWQSSVELERELARAGVSRSRRTMPVLAAVAGLLAVAAVLVYFYYVRRSPAALTEKDTIVLADFDNRTGDPVFDDALRQGLAAELQQSPLLTLLSDRKVQRTLTLMGRPKEARLTANLAQEVCERTASSAVLEGSIARVGSQYVVGLRTKNCSTGSILDQQQVAAATREDVLKALSQIARDFRTRVGESLTALERHAPPATVTTPSFEALTAYGTGVKVLASTGNAASLPFFRRAVELDPDFAMAWAHLGLDYSAVGESVLAVESTKKSWSLRDRVSDREQFFIDFSYDRQVTGNLEKAYQTLDLWIQTYPRGENPNPHDLLGGLSTHGTGRFERAVEASQKTIAADPNFIFGYQNLATGQYCLDRFSEAERAMQGAYEHHLDAHIFSVIRYNIAAIQGNDGEMGRLVSASKGHPIVEHWLAHEEALALARSGRLRAAREASSRAVELALQEGKRESAASYLAASAVWEAMSGNSGEGRKRAAAALELSNGRDVQYAAAFALALLGEASRAEVLADDLEKRFPEDTFVKFTYVPVLRGLAALDRGRATDSVDRLQMALRYELAANGLNFNHFYLGGLHAAYVRGEAFRALGRYTEAAAEFQKVLDHPGLVGLDPIGAMARLQLGRIHVLSGDAGKAKQAYSSFFALWKQADADVPVLKPAQSEYARFR